MGLSRLFLIYLYMLERGTDQGHGCVSDGGMDAETIPADKRRCEGRHSEKLLRNEECDRSAAASAASLLRRKGRQRLLRLRPAARELL